MPIREKIETLKARVGIIGLGYVGLPLALEFAKKGMSVVGFDVDPNKIRSLNRSHSYIPDVPSEALREVVQAKKLSATADFRQLSKMDAVIICVPTPLRKTKDPDITYIVSAVDQVKKGLKKGQLIVLESTTYPGTTRELVLTELEKTDLRVGKDFYLAFSPERVDPGNKKFGIKNTPKIVGGITPACTEIACLLYNQIVDSVVPVSSSECAEMAKLLENTFRAVNIALVNEVALMCDRLKLDTWEVIDAAASKPFGFMPFYPGPGIGGHCIPLDPHYLSWKLKSLNFISHFIELAGELNSRMPEYVVERVADALNRQGKSVNGSKILILGVAYKKDVGDVRESPALDIIELLEKKKARLCYHDPYVPRLQINHWSAGSTPLDSKTIKNQDCVVVVTHHSCVNMGHVVEHAKLIFDTRNATKGFRGQHIFKI